MFACPRLPCLKVALCFIACDREQAGQCAATRDFSFGKLLVFRGRQRFRCDLIDDIGRNHHDTVAIADDDVARIDRDAATGDRQVEIARMVRDRARWRSRTTVIGRQASLEDAVSVAQPTVGDDAGAAARLQTPDIEIACRSSACIAT